METKIDAGLYTFKFSDSDVVNPDDMIPQGEYNPHDVRGWLIHDHGFTVCFVFASSLQDALDEAADSGRLNFCLIPTDRSTDDDRAQTGLLLSDYITADPDRMAEGFDRDCPEFVIDGVPHSWEREPAFLGNAGEPFDIESLDYVEIAPPTASICALYNAEPRGVQSLSVHV